MTAVHPSHGRSDALPHTRATPYLAAAFTLVIILMLVVAVLGWIRVEALHTQMDHLTQRHAEKLDRMHRMRSIVRERFIRMSLIVSTDDPFLRDEYAQEFGALAREFMAARADVERLTTEPTEVALLEELRRLNALGTPIMVSVVEAGLENQQELALSVLLDQSLPKQERVMAHMDLILDTFQQAYQQALDELAQTREQTRRTFLLTAMVATLLIFIIALNVTGRIQRQQEDLLSEVEARRRTEALLRETQEGLERSVAERTAALRETTARLEDAQRIAGVGHWDWDIERGRLHWSDSIYQLFGLPRQGELASYEHFMAAVHPDDRQILQQAVDRALAGDAPYQVDHRIVRPDGEIRHVREEAEVTRDSTGQPVRMLGTVRDITADIAIQQQLWHLAHHDPLSALPNRNLFRALLDQALERTSRSGKKLAVMLCDLDGFKAINDRHGHATGDQVIIHTARRLKGAIRRSDVAARLAGDEFVVLLEDLNDAEEAVAVAGKLLKDINAPIALAAAEVSVGISIGIAVSPEHGETAETLMAGADAAMYAAKAAGKGSIRLAGD
ncbi:putative diguanylate cyclase [Thioalkalivibrio sulfidiphilus HL-EbGr7]|uniref:Putative diguanylate cyclase n=1 Tax=Thioalkalivibrio sulfidiphilus (strain HL-EbGR7) TaxID=396588 RepID=B8GPG6_THISH|nr:putative diguanylate cyclase [Thioalkalivibrio sulfidiphilus HL-EbGr7]